MPDSTKSDRQSDGTIAPAGRPARRRSVSGMAFDTSAVIAREAVRKVGRSGVEPQEFFYEVAVRIRRVVPYDASGWMSLDPDTMLPSGALETDKSPELVRRLWRNELLEGDVHKLAELADRPSPIAALSQLDAATAAESPRIQLVHGPAGIGDELRVMLRAGGATWGHFALYRELGARDFDAGERKFIADITTDIAEGLRRSLSRPAGPDADVIVPGVVAFDPSGTITSATADANRLMAQMPGDATATLYAVAIRASRCDSARARVRLVDGRWMLLHGARMHGPCTDVAGVTVTLVPAPRTDVTTLILRLHGLTAREREVADLMMLGSATDEIAACLYISRHTLHDHIKAIFAKVGATSRSELMAIASGYT
jgi:DNA-binding CsgD family transcriptional regulator